MLLCGLNSEGPLNKTEDLFLQIDQINPSLSKIDNQREIKNAEGQVVKLSEIRSGFYQTCYHTNPIPFYNLLCFQE